VVLDVLHERGGDAESATPDNAGPP
jgi:hypothetical protein